MQSSSRDWPSVRVFRDSTQPVLDMFGATVQFLTTPEDAGESLCVLRCVIPSGAIVPMHSHTEIECFLMLSGQQEVLVESNGSFSWRPCLAGDFIEIPSGAKHAFRNQSADPAVSVVATTARLGHFFQDAGRYISPTYGPLPPTPGAVRLFHTLTTRYGCWLATSEENAAAGLPLH